jgi:hypothetical protein
MIIGKVAHANCQNSISLSSVRESAMPRHGKGGGSHKKRQAADGKQLKKVLFIDHWSLLFGHGL